MGRRESAVNPTNRNGVWYLDRRVPVRFIGVTGRKRVMVSTGIPVVDDPRAILATTIVRDMYRGLITQWQTALATNTPCSPASFAEVTATARRYNLVYRPARDYVDDAASTEVYARLKVIKENKLAPQQAKVDAVLGMVEPPRLMLSGLVEAYREATATDHLGKSPKQLIKWRNPRDYAVDVFCKAIGGDKALADITRKDVLDFRTVLQNRTLANEISIDTANKILGYVAGMYRKVNALQVLPYPVSFQDLKLTGQSKENRKPIAVEVLVNQFLRTGMFDDLNEEARRVMFVMIETGMRPSEVCNLLPHRIRLDAPVPHVQIRADNRKLKTKPSERDIPLVGVALMALTAQPKGFPRYRDNEDTLSALLSKAMSNRNLLEEGQSLYSIRHTFKDRLRAAKVDTEMRDELMGHSHKAFKYGAGFSLQDKQAALQSISLPPPDYV